MDENEDKFEFDESLIDEVSNSEEFSGEDVSREEVVDAIGAIDALAEVAIEKLGGEQADINADELLEKVQELVDDGASDEDFEDEGFDEDEEEEFDEEEEELPEEIENSMIRVMVSDDDTIKVEKTPDEIYDATIDDIPATVFDTGDIPEVDVEDEGETDEDGVLVIGNSHSRKFRKGFVKVTSCKNNKAWSAAYKKVKKMIGSAKLTAYHWAIVSSLAKAYDKAEKAKKQKLQSCLLKLIKNNKDYTAKFGKLLKSDVEEPISDQGQTEKDVKPEETVQNNPGVNEEKDLTEEKSPEEVDSEHKDVEPPAPWDKNDEVVVPEENIIHLEVPVKGITQKLILRKVASSKKRNASTYKVLNASKIASFVASGKIVKMGNVACAFKKTPEGTFACFARFEKADGKTKYVPVIKSGVMVITKGEESPAFAIASSFEKRRKMANKIESSRRTPLTNSRLRNRLASDWKKEITTRVDEDNPESTGTKGDKGLRRNILKDMFKECDWSYLKEGLDDKELREAVKKINPEFFSSKANLRTFLLECAKENIPGALEQLRVLNKLLGMSYRRPMARRPLASARMVSRRPLTSSRLERPVTVRRPLASRYGRPLPSRRPIASSRFERPSRLMRRPLVSRRIYSEDEKFRNDMTMPVYDWETGRTIPKNPTPELDAKRYDIEYQIEEQVEKVLDQWGVTFASGNFDRELLKAVDYISLSVEDLTEDMGLPLDGNNMTVAAATRDWMYDTALSYPDTFKILNPKKFEKQLAIVKRRRTKDDEEWHNRNTDGSIPKDADWNRISNIRDDDEELASAKKDANEDEEVIESKKDEATESKKDECVNSECDSKKEKKEETKEEIESRVRKMYEAEERKRLFQSSQDAIAEDKAVIKESVTRNSTALDKLYSSMF